MPSSRATLLTALLGLSCATPGARSPAPLLEADRAFAEEARLHGVPAAFTRFAAPDAWVLKASGPERGREAVARTFAGREKMDLRWEPKGGELSADGEQGYTWGTWTLTMKGEAPGVPLTGRYLTTWRRTAEGYRWTADLGESDPPPPAAAPPPCPLCGTWLLVDRVDRLASGAVVPEPSLGSDPLGRLTYDASGRVAVQLMRRDRPAAASGAAVAGAGNDTGAAGGYDASFGTYQLDPEGRTVTHRLEGAVAPGDVGKALTRTFALEGDQLTLSFDTLSGGRPVRRTLRWQRAR